MLKKYGLFIDVGNTLVKIGIGDTQALINSCVIPTKDFYNRDILKEKIFQFIDHTKEQLKNALIIEKCMVSSVVPDINNLLCNICEYCFNLSPQFIHKDIIVPLINHYEKPTEVGADRLVAAYAARVLYPEYNSMIIVDYGTATTFDCIQGDVYLGGLICPGVFSSFEALLIQTALLPDVSLTKVDDKLLIGKNTKLSLRYGFSYGFRAMTEGIYTQLCKLLSSPVFFIATGGFAYDIADNTPCINMVCPDLILEGLRFLWLLE